MSGAAQALRGRELLEAARRQAEDLGNLVRGLELLLAGLPEAELEERYHLRVLARWIDARLTPARRAATTTWPGIDALLGPPAALLPRQSSPPLEIGATVLLLDAEASGEGFLARLALEPATGGETMPAGAGARVVEALAFAEQQTIRLLARRGRLPPRAASGLCWRWQAPSALRGGALSVDGASLGAAAAVALFSAWTEIPVPPGFALTGVLGPEGSLRAVEGLEAKLAAARREAPELSILVPSEGFVRADLRVRATATLEELLIAVFGPAALEGAGLALLEVEGTVRLGVELYEKRQSFAAAEEVLCLALDGIATRRRSAGKGALRVEEFLALWRAGSARVHLGDPEGAGELLERARSLGDELWSAGELNPQLYLGARGNFAVLLRDLSRLAEAEALLRETLQLQRELRQDKREIARSLGNLGELLGIAGRHREAEEALEEALAALLAVYPDEVPRELCYLGDLELRRGAPVRALERYQEGLSANRAVVYGREANHAFLRYGQVRALAALGRPEAALRLGRRAVGTLPAHQPYPRQLILKQLGLCELAIGEEELGRATLEAAADLRFARGALARFAFATARGELALHRLARGELERGASEANAFAEASRSLLDGLWRTGLAETLSRLCHAGDPPALADALRSAIELLPY